MWWIFTLLIIANVLGKNLCHQHRDELENVDFCSRHLNISRANMPQLTPVVEECFIHYLHVASIVSWSTILNHAEELSSTQNEIHSLITSSLFISLEKHGQRDPIYISTDGHVLDGHHRWVALLYLKRDVKATIIDLPIETLLELARFYSTESHV